MADSTPARLNRPTKAGVAFPADKPWEAFGFDAYSTVVQDPHNSSFPWRLYYAAAVAPAFARHVMCVALSRDGVSWLKPDLGLVTWDGSSATNIVFPTANASRGGPHSPGRQSHSDTTLYISLEILYTK
jgi:hypothetical protein